MKIQIQTNFPDIAKALDAMSNNLATRVSLRAVNDMAAQAKTRMSKAITDEFNITATKVKSKLWVTKANFRDGRFRISAELLGSVGNKRNAINVIAFSAKQAKTGVSVRIKKAGGRKIIKGAFIANKGRTVFERVGPNRKPIKPVNTIDVAQMFTARKTNGDVVRFINSKFPEIFNRQLAFALSQFNQVR
jgi:hypothetical protein